MGIKNYFQKKALEKQLKDLPEAQKKLFTRLFEENPELFKAISAEIKMRKDEGQDEMLATVSVMRKYEPKMQELIKKMK